MSDKRPLRLGLTGGIGSGKSTVARMLAGCGAAVIDADAVSRACTAPGGAAIPGIAQRFGGSFVTKDGSLDRDRMRALVFDDPSARQTLQALLHPLIGEEIRRQTVTARSSGARCIVFDVPLLVESLHWRAQLDRVLVIDCLQTTQKQRVRERSGWDDDTTEAVLRSQASRAQRLAAADAVIFNDGLNLEQLQRVVNRAARAFGL